MRRFLLFALATALATLAAGPSWAGDNVWTASGPDGGPIRALLVNPSLPTTLYAGTMGRGVFKSIDGGATWTQSDPTGDISTKTIRSLVFGASGTIYAGADNDVNSSSGVFQSNDGGDSWTPIGTAAKLLTNRKVQALAWDGTYLYAGTREESPVTGGVFRWDGLASTWTRMNGPLDCQSGGSCPAPSTGNLLNQSSRRVQALAVDMRPPSGPVIYAGTQGEAVFKSVDRGANWTRIDNDAANQSHKGFQSDCLMKPEILALAVDTNIALTSVKGLEPAGAETGAVLYAGATGSVGTTGCNPTPTEGGHKGQAAGFFRFVPAGPVGGYPQGSGIPNLCIDQPGQPLGCWDRRMAGDFEELLPNTVSSSVWTIAMNGTGNATTVYIGTDHGVFRSVLDVPPPPALANPYTLTGNWDRMPKPIDPDVTGLISLPVRALGLDPSGTVTLYAGTNGRGVFKRPPPNNGASVGPQTWEPATTGISALRAQAIAMVTGYDGFPQFFAGLNSGGIIASSNGTDWEDTSETERTIRSIAADPGEPTDIYAATSRGVVKSEDGGATWALASNNLPLVCNDPAEEAACIAANSPNDPNPPRTVRSIFVDPVNPGVVYAAVAGVHTSVDGGATWAPLNGTDPNVQKRLPSEVTCGKTCPGDGTVSAFLVDHSAGHPVWGTIYVASDVSGITNPTITAQGIWKSADGGASWTSSHFSIDPADLSITALALDPMPQAPITLTIYAGTSTGKVYFSQNGTDWTVRNSGLPLVPGKAITALAVEVADPKLVPGQGTSASVLYATVNGGGVYFSTNGGLNWTARNEGPLASLDVLGFAVDYTRTPHALYAATLSRGLYHFEVVGTDPAPVITPVSPSSGAQAGASPIDVIVTVEDETAVSRVLWSTSRGHSGEATSVGGTAWTAPGVPLEPGVNAITLTAVDSASNEGSRTIIVTFDPPDPPGSLGQFKSNGTTAIAVGATTTETTVVLKGTVVDPLGETVKLQVEVKPVGTAFTGQATHESSLQSSGTEAAVTVPSLTNNTNYHWQARTVTDLGTMSDWQSFGGNAESATDFRVGQQPASCPTATQFVDNLPPGQISSKIGFTGTWTTAAAAKPWGVNASLVSNTGPNMSYTWKPGVFSTTLACKYQVWVWWTSATNRTNKATYTVLNTTAGNIAKTFNQQTGGGKWQLHGTYTFPANVQPKVRIANLNGGRIAADAVKFVFQP